MTKSPSPNSTISHYRILSKIGTGGMGEVYLAEDIKLDRKVALKILPPEFAKDKERMSRFVREAKSASALNHPNILTIYEIDETESGHFIATEFIVGETLRERARRVPITLGEALDIATQTASALAAAHQAGIIHRDIKPENVMVRDDGLVKVLDFGLAKLTVGGVSDPESETRIHSETQPGMIMGTVAYMSPQQARGQVVDRRTDVWSLGVVLYELLCDRHPFRGDTPTDTLANILQREPEPLNIAALPADLAQIVGKMLAKDLDARYSTLSDVVSDLKRLQKRIEFEAELRRTPLSDMRTEPQTRMIQSAERLSEIPIDSGAARADEGFWVAVLPFKHRGGSSDLEALAEGLSEEIVTGLSRFSYLKVIARSSTLGFTESTDIRSVGKQLGARYVMEGSLRQAGSMLRVTVQLVDTSSGAHIWAESYNRTFCPESVFELQDDLVPQIVSTVADRYGALVHSMSESVRGRAAGQYSPHEAALRGFGFHERLTPQEHAEVRDILEAAVAEAPDHSNCNAMLASLYWHEFSNGYNTRPDPLGRALAVARQAVAAAPANNIAHYSLATALFFKKDFSAFRPAAEHAIALNPMDASSTAFLGILISYSGDWEYGRGVTERAMRLNPHHPSWYYFGAFYDAYRERDYRAALEVALKVNIPDYLHTYASLAASYAQLGELERARAAVRELLARVPDYGSKVRELLGHWFDTEMVEHLIDGLRKAGLEVVETEHGITQSGGTQSAIHRTGSTKPSIVVLPFTNISADQENEYFSDGLTEELISDLSKVRSLRVISRNSALKLKGTIKDLKTIASELDVRYVLDGSVRKAGQNLRISAQLIEAVSDENLWSEKYDGTLADIFEMQESVSRSIVDALEITLSADEERKLAERPIADAEAYDFYLQARSQFLQGVPAALDRSIDLLTQGLEIIGENELLYAALGYTYWFYFRWISKLDENRLRLASECMQKTFALNPSSSHGFVLKGLLSYSEGNMAEAIRSLKKALEVQPNNTEALFWLAVNSSHVGNNEAAMKYADQLLTLDPLSPINTVIKGVVYVYKGEFSEALPWIEQGLAMDQSSPLLIWTTAIVDAWAGRTDEAIVHVDMLAQIAPEWVYTQHGLFLKHALRGEKELALQYDTAELTKEAEHDCHFALHLAHCFALVHENEKALDFLELAVRTGMVNYPFLNSFDPLLENIRGEERFQVLMAAANKLSRHMNDAG